MSYMHEYQSYVAISLSHSLFSLCPLFLLRLLCTVPSSVLGPLSLPWLSVPHSRCFNSGSWFSRTLSLSSCLSLSLSVWWCFSPVWVACLSFASCVFAQSVVFQVCMVERSLWGSGPISQTTPHGSMFFLYYVYNPFRTCYHDCPHCKAHWCQTCDIWLYENIYLIWLYSYFQLLSHISPCGGHLFRNLHTVHLNRM